MRRAATDNPGKLAPYGMFTNEQSYPMIGYWEGDLPEPTTLGVPITHQRTLSERLTSVFMP